MWIVFGILLTFFAVVHSQGSESIVFPDIIKILKSQPYTDVSEQCAEHLNYYLDNVLKPQKENLWAFQMVDSITKFPDGIMMGHLSIPGVFDECVDAENEKFSGKHCMAQLTLKLGEKQLMLLNRFRTSDPQSGASFSYGICVPSTCNSTDIENAIKNVKELQGYVSVNISDNDCSTKEFRPFRQEDWITVVVLGVILFVALGSTVYDLLQRLMYKNENPNPLWSSYSIYTNGKLLFRISQSTSQLKCLHGIRFLSMSWVILGHSYFSYLFANAINLIEVPKVMVDKSFLPVSNAFVSVDSFFFLSGLLVCLVFFRDIAKKKSFDVPVAFIHRYVRLTPPFALLMLIQGTIISRIGNGPFWNTRTDQVENACRESWWSGVLYIQNYMKPSLMCLGQAWYLSADMQMYWVSPLILYPILYFPVYAPYFLLVLVLAAAFTNFAIAFANDLGYSLLMNMSMSQFELEYTPFHTRMAPWLVGLATGYIICGLEAKKIRLNMSKVTALIGWLVALALLGGSLFGIARFVGVNKDDYSTAEASFYLAFHRVGWALGMAWVVVACVSGYGGPVNNLLSLDIFQPLGKLSYCNFLIHMTIQNYRMNSARTNPYIKHFDVVYGYFGDLVASNLISIPIILLFEIPFTNIDRHFLRKLVIFPWPRPNKQMEKDKEEKLEKPGEELQDTEKGKINPAFSDS